MERLNRLYLVRHGQVVGFDEIRANGHTDVKITETGKIQMESLASRLRVADIKALYSSDLERTKIGARIIGRHHDLKHNIMPELREVFFGDWEGMSMDEIREEYPVEYEKRQKAIADYRPPGKGENMRDLSERIIPCLKRILEAQNGNDILIVAHGGVNRAILCDALGLDIKNLFNISQDYGCLNIIDYYPNHPIVKLTNG